MEILVFITNFAEIIIGDMEKVFKISDECIKRMYLDGYSLNDIAKIAQDTKGLMALRNRLHKLGVDTTKDMKKYRYKISDAGKIYNLDDTVFNTIDTEEKAYWLGFLMADGYNHQTKNCVALRVQKEDKEILEKYKLFLKTDTPIYTFNRTTKINKLNRSYCELNICSPKFSESLANIGCVQGKTYTLEFPNISKLVEHHFIRGFFDGDGCISITKRKDRTEKSYQYQLNFVGKESVLLKIQDIICENTGVFKTKLRNRENNFAKCISWGGRKVCKKILDYLYKDATIYLERKYNKYLQLGNSVE